MYAADEDLFWDIIALHRESLSGHIKNTFGFNRLKIKLTHKELAPEKFSQITFNRILSGNTFKSLIHGSLVIPLCPGCEQNDCTWEHFFSCFRLGEVPRVVLRDPLTIAELARGLAKIESEIREASSHSPIP